MIVILKVVLLGIAGLVIVQEEPDTTPPKSNPPSLDELLGIEGDTESEEAAQAERERALDRSLTEEKPAAALKQAILDMDLSSLRLRENQATGLGIQRLQTRIIDRLQSLIDSAQRQEQQQQQSSSSNSDSGQDPGSRSKEEQPGEGEGQQQGQQGQQTQGGEPMPGDPPPPEHAILESQLDETRIEWGTLPPRVRELINQGMRDRMSELYRSLTEAYYKRMAEDASK